MANRKTSARIAKKASSLLRKSRKPTVKAVAASALSQRAPKRGKK